MNIYIKPTWLKNRGYIHITNQIDISRDAKEVLRKVRDKDYVSKHAFFPLIHTSIVNRRYNNVLKTDDKGNQRYYRTHCHNGKPQGKPRPLHYATHIDSMIFGYYGEILQKNYIKELNRTLGLETCVTAYRRIPKLDKPDNCKSTIDFAHEVFEEIKLRGQNGCCVLKFDIEKFFSSINHTVLKKVWAQIIHEDYLPKDHYSVFKAATKFSFILKDDLRINSSQNGRKSGFDERKLAEIRKLNVSAFFESPSDFRAALENKLLTVYKNNFKNSHNEMIGIPQGLPISATLANLYLLGYDKTIFQEVVVKKGGFYRRYSDDMIIICDRSDHQFIEDLVKTSLIECCLEISDSKTEKHYFKPVCEGDGSNKLMNFEFDDDGKPAKKPLTYLGFEFYGYKTLIKSANLAKFYRRMISAIKTSSNRAALASKKLDGSTNQLFKRRLFQLYSSINLEKKKPIRRNKYLAANKFGQYVINSKIGNKKLYGNYFTYASRAANLMNEPAILNQLRRHKIIFNQARIRFKLLNEFAGK